MSSVCPAKFVRRGNYDDRCLASGKFAFLSCKKSEQPPVPRNVQSCRLECIIRFASCTNYTSVRYLRGETLASSPIFLHRIYSQSQYLSPRPSSSNTSDRIATRRGTIYYFGRRSSNGGGRRRRLSYVPSLPVACIRVVCRA